MVAETTEVTFFGSIDEFALAERHEIKVLDSFLIILVHAAPESRLGDDFANILEDEIIGFEVSVCAKSITFFVRFDDRDVAVLFLLKALVLAIGAAPAISGALHLGRTIDAVGVFTTGMVSSRLAIYGKY